MNFPPLTVVLAGPRGFCAGVDRAVQIVERAIEKFGAPIFVRHEIVHNRFVVERLEAKGAVFINEIDQVPADRPVIFSAHGVPKSVLAAAAARNMLYIDATCPLVSKVHREAEQATAEGRHVLLIGHAGHPEVVGTIGQLSAGAITLIESITDAESCAPPNPDRLTYLTQTTLSVDDTAAIVAVLQRRFPTLTGPRKDDICYATTNRQAAVRALAAQCDSILIIGAPNSSNSLRLVEVARASGCSSTRLVQRADEIDWTMLKGVERLGLSASASAPDVLVDEVLVALRARFSVTVSEHAVAHEDIFFRLPHMLEA
ncbi:MAG: 4-hydroxy-3-methylbut-2-enyl diphosphate reductase [Alphaproteobacteria bacterium]|nr:4-hydroxy-3-methylbut-2-enyl diphosphate reductase [Alphaproteobacteria bacterium]